jgi:hypothetical protein
LVTAFPYSKIFIGLMRKPAFGRDRRYIFIADFHFREKRLLSEISRIQLINHAPAFILRFECQDFVWKNARIVKNYQDRLFSVKIRTGESRNQSGGAKFF